MELVIALTKRENLLQIRRRSSALQNTQHNHETSHNTHAADDPKTISTVLCPNDIR